MSNWVSTRKFRLVKEPTRHYVLQHNNAGNTEINVPKNIANKLQAQRWLRAHPNAVKNPTRYRAKGKKASPMTAWMLPNELRRRHQFPGNDLRIYKYAKGVVFPGKMSPKFSPTGNIVENLRRAGKIEAYSPSQNNWNLPANAKFANAFKRKKLAGKGRQGIVFVVSPFKGGQKPFALKVVPRDLAAASRREPQPIDVEFNIQKKAQACSPQVVRVYKSYRRQDFLEANKIDMPNVQNSSKYDKTKQGILMMEYCPGGNALEWLKWSKQTGDATLQRMIKEVLGALFKIQSKYPYFRHNDLHLQNVFVGERGFMIGDFGWARLEKSGTNPAVNTANGTRTASHWGVGPNTNSRYDYHMFLNELLAWAETHDKAKHPKTIAFLKEVIPSGYRGKDSVHTEEWRLKYNDPCPGLPTLAQVLKNPFLKSVSSPELRAVKAKLKKTGRKMTPPRVKSAPKRLSTPPKPKTLSPVPVPSASPRIRSANLKAARAKLKPVRPLRKLSPSQLKAARAKLKHAVRGKGVPRNVIKHAKFDKLIEWYWRNNGGKPGENAWNSARSKALRLVELRLHRGNLPFSPGGAILAPKSVTKILAIPHKASLEAVKAPTKNLAAAAARMRQHAANLAAKRVKIVVTTKVKPASPGKKVLHQYSPTSGRIKVRGPTGRLAYVNGSTITMNFLKSLAAQRGVNVKGLRSKVNIAKRIFSRNNK